MENESFLNKLKHRPKIWAALSFIMLFIIVMILFGGRKSEFLKIAFLLKADPDFYFHVSNFTISFLICAGVGYAWLLLGIPFKFIIALCLFMLLSNFIYELFIPILNTPDIIDAWYGFAGTILALTFLFMVKMFGLMPNPLAKENKF